MITKVEKARLGIFIIASSAVVVAVFITLAGIEFMKRHDTYKVHFEETVSGLEVGAQVKYNGVRVGQVSSIEIDSERLGLVTVYLDLKKDTPIKDNTEAVLVSMGITGLKFIELTGGTNEADLILPGSTIKAGHSFFGTIEGKTEDIAVKVELAVSKINAVLSENNIVKINNILTNTQNATRKADRLLDNNEEKINAIIDDLTQVSKDLEKGVASAGRSADTVESILIESKPKVASILTNVNQATTAVKETAKDIAKVDNILKKLEKTLANINKDIEAVKLKEIAGSLQSTVEGADATIRSVRRIVEASRENLYKSTKSLESTMSNLEDFSAELRKQPSLLLRSKPPEQRTPPDKTRRNKR